MKLAAAALILCALILLSGCASRTIPSACQAAKQGMLANCVYVNSVLEQNPYYCYSIADLEQRKTCLRDASEPSMKSAIERAPQAEKDSIFAPPQLPPSYVEVPPAPPQEKPAPIKPGECNSKTGAEKDACLKAAAISNLDMAACRWISDAAVRKACISDVARKTKDISSCSLLNSTDDINLCKVYAKGEDAKS